MNVLVQRMQDFDAGQTAEPQNSVLPMRIEVGFDIEYATAAPTPIVIMLNIHPSRVRDVIGRETIITDPQVAIRYYLDSFGNICGRFTAPAGGIRLRGHAVVADSGKPDPVVRDARQLSIEHLPDECLLYLMGSRYCETDRLADIAWALFKETEPGWSRVQAVCDFVHGHLTFGYQHAHPGKTAFDAYRERQGVCRDFAHLAITFCRCLNIPARYVTGYLGDIGVPPSDAPMDFSGWFEAYLGGKWYAFDARNNQPRIGRILMATGRDAADVALTTSFGHVDLRKFAVFTDEMTDTLE
jgi:transglutaminase-like putative cysteine protease